MRRRRTWVVFAVLALGLATVQARLVQLQWMQHELWARESRRSTMTFETVPFERGWILDRNGVPFARCEEVRDLVFRYGDWRRASVLGQVASLVWLIDGERLDLAWLDDHLAAVIDELAGLRTDTLATLPGARRLADVRYYVEEIFGREVRDGLQRHAAAHLDDGALQPVALGTLPGFDDGALEALARAGREREALDRLAEHLGLDRRAVLTQLGEEIQAIDRRVAARVGSITLDGTTFKAVRDEHAWIDYEERRLSSPVDFDVETLVALRRRELPGFAVRVENRRTYPEAVADVAVTLIGRVGSPDQQRDLDPAAEHRRRLADLAAVDDELSAEELYEYEQLRLFVREIDYRPDEQKGVLGLEASLEPLLRGKRGWVATHRDPDAAEELFGESAPPQRGLNVTLTLDVELQAACERVLDELEAYDEVTGSRFRPPGAIVLLDPRDGAVLALASAPRPTRETLATDYGRLVEDPRRPLENRALGAGNLPPPGSTFKPVAALALLGADVIDGRSTFECERYLTVGRDHRKKCLGRHGPIALREALAYSCNIYFYKASERIDGRALVEFARRFGLAEDPGLVDNDVLARLGLRLAPGLRVLPGEIASVRFTPAETMQLAVGQHPLDDVTPLQVASMLGAVGSGRRVPPRILASVEGYGPVPPRAAVDLGVSEIALGLVREGLEAAVDEGSARAGLTAVGTFMEPADRARLEDLNRHIAGKTGTPQVAGRKDHAWFAGYMPRQAPALAFAVFVEHPGLGGSKIAVPTFRRLLEQPEMIAFLEREVLP